MSPPGNTPTSRPSFTTIPPTCRSSDGSITEILSSGDPNVRAIVREAAGNGWVRVMKEDGAKLAKGRVIRTELTYALGAPDGRKIPIDEIDLAMWLDDFYTPGLNKRHLRAAFVRDQAKRGMWKGTDLGSVSLRRGDWTIWQSDEAAVSVSQMHTKPLSMLQFKIDDHDTVRAHYPENTEDLSAATFGDRNSDEVPNINKTQEGY